MKRRSTRGPSDPAKEPPAVTERTQRVVVRAMIDSAASQASALVAENPHSLTARAGFVVIAADLAMRDEDAELLEAYRAAIVEAKTAIDDKRAAAAADDANVIDLRAWSKARR